MAAVEGGIAVANTIEDEITNADERTNADGRTNADAATSAGEDAEGSGGTIVIMTGHIATTGWTGGVGRATEGDALADRIATRMRLIDRGEEIGDLARRTGAAFRPVRINRTEYTPRVGKGFNG